MKSGELRLKALLPKDAAPELVPCQYHGPARNDRHQFNAEQGDTEACGGAHAWGNGGAGGAFQECGTWCTLQLVARAHGVWLVWYMHLRKHQKHNCFKHNLIVQLIILSAIYNY